MLSTIHNDGIISKRQRTRHAVGGREEIEKPVMIEQYNTYMGGVDKADQLLSYYGFNHCTIKWWKRTFFPPVRPGYCELVHLYQVIHQNNHHINSSEYSWQ